MKQILSIILALTMFQSCTVIGPSERGARFNFGKVSEEVLQPGTHLWIPYLAGSETFDTKIVKGEAVVSSGTKDQQEVKTTVAVNVQIDATKIIDIVKTLGSEEAVFDRIRPLIEESVNASISKYSAEEVLTKRQQLKKDIEDLVRAQVTKYGFIVHDVSIQDMQYSKEYADSIEAKQIAEQRAKQAEYETQRAVQDANAAVAKARGEAEANRLRLVSLTPQLLQLKAIEKWKGEVPQYMGGSGALPFINLNGTK